MLTFWEECHKFPQYHVDAWVEDGNMDNGYSLHRVESFLTEAEARVLYDSLRITEKMPEVLMCVEYDDGDHRDIATKDSTGEYF